MSNFNDPITRIEWRQCKDLKANDYNPNVCMGQEFKLLEFSILKNGWIQPILINRNNMIIDGFHRWTLAQKSELIFTQYKGQVPCVVMDIDDAKAMLLTVRINRSKGTHVAYRMSEMVRKLVDDFDYEFDEIQNEIGAYKGEVELLYKDGVFKRKNIEKYKYSEAWEPRK